MSKKGFYFQSHIMMEIGIAMMVLNQDFVVFGMEAVRTTWKNPKYNS